MWPADDCSTIVSEGKSVLPDHPPHLSNKGVREAPFIARACGPQKIVERAAESSHAVEGRLQMALSKGEHSILRAVRNCSHIVADEWGPFHTTRAWRGVDLGCGNK